MVRKLLARLHPEGIPWPATLIYNRLSRTHIFRDHYRLVAEDVAARRPQGRLLDIGTGPARLLPAVHKLCPALRLTGVDISAAMVQQARRNMERAGLADAVALEVAAADHLPFADGAFDTVISTGSIHHWKDVGAGLAEVHRVLRPGGLALMYDLVTDLPREVSKDLVRRYGRFRTTLLWLHTFEEPFRTAEDFAALARGTPFRAGPVRFVGAFCCLELEKAPSVA
jgi:ubiquinone/menaquinone biosynthesis C-methylase UbiE